MPYRRRRRPAARRRRPATRRFIPRALAVKRTNQVSTRVFYFKQNGTILPFPAGAFKAWQTADLITNPPAGFEDLAKLYDQYKILALKVCLFAANIGSESADPNPPTVAPSFWARGNTIVYSDQRTADPVVPPASISDVINYASARMISSRSAHYSRNLFRPKGQPLWASLDSTLGAPDTDNWKGSIQLKNEGASYLPPAGNRPLYYWTLCYKVIVRGRVQQ